MSVIVIKNGRPDTALDWSLVPEEHRYVRSAEMQDRLDEAEQAVLVASGALMAATAAKNTLLFEERLIEAEQAYRAFAAQGLCSKDRIPDFMDFLSGDQFRLDYQLQNMRRAFAGERFAISSTGKIFVSGMLDLLLRKKRKGQRG